MATGDDLRRLALALPGVEDKPHMDRAAFRVARIFVTLGPDSESANFKFTPEEQELKCLVAADAFATNPNGWGRQGWTQATLANLTETELDAALRMAWAHAQPTPRKR